MIALTIGKPGEAIAAAFDSRGGLMLVLAKNDDVTYEDYQAVRDLFEVIISPETGDVCDVLPFLFPRFRKNIEKQTTKIHEAVSRVAFRKSYWTTTPHTPSLELRFSDLKKRGSREGWAKSFLALKGTN